MLYNWMIFIFLIDSISYILAYANRSCLRTSESQGMWAEPELENCLLPTLLSLKTEVKGFVLP